MDGAVEHTAHFKRFVMNILWQYNDDSPSQSQKLRRATWGNGYSAQLLFG